MWPQAGQPGHEQPMSSSVSSGLRHAPTMAPVLLEEEGLGWAVAPAGGPETPGGAGAPDAPVPAEMGLLQGSHIVSVATAAVGCTSAPSSHY